MFQFLYIFGPAAITFLVIRRLSDKPEPSLITGIIEIIAYAVINAALTTLLLYPFGRVELVFNSEGIRDIRYGVTAFFLSMILAVITGIILAAFDKRIHLELQVTENTKSGKYNNEEQNAEDKENKTDKAEE